MSKIKMILVEDELPARTVFRQMLENQHELCDLVGEGEDGREGLALYWKHKPQIIVTDITMPSMSGLEMLQEIEKSGETLPQTVILTCHQDFHFARQAIQLKAVSYLLKDDCLSDPELLPRTVERLCHQMSSLDRTREEQLLMERKVRSNLMEIERNLYLDRLRSSEAEAMWLRSLQQASIPVDREGFEVLLLDLDFDSLRFSSGQREHLKLWQFAGVNVLSELLDSAGANKVIALDQGRFFAIFHPGRRLEGSVLREQVRQAFQSFLKLNVFVLHCVIDNTLTRQTTELMKLSSASYPFFYSDNTTVTFAEWEKGSRYQPIPEAKRHFWNKALKRALLESHLTSMPMEQTSSAFYREAGLQCWEPEQIKSLYHRIFLDITHFAADPSGLMDFEAEFRSRLEQSQTFRAVNDAMVACFRKLHEQRADANNIDASITRLIQHIHEDLSYPYKLQELAASINYSVPYFSGMFKKTTGESFIQYMTRLRIEKAQLLLLTTDFKTFEIAEAVGFENYRSFNRIFKKETGMSPSDFRNKK